MQEWTIYGVTLTFDVEDADEMEKLESALAKMSEEELEIKNQKEQGNLSMAKQLKRYCMLFRHFFDNLFGEGTSEKIFAEQKMKPSVHEIAYLNFLDFVKLQNTATFDKKQKLWSKYQVQKPKSKS